MSTTDTPTPKIKIMKEAQVETENLVKNAFIKMILTTYSVYVFKCMAAKIPMEKILTGDDWYEQIYKQQ